MRCLFVEIYWCVVEAILEYYWRVLNVILKKSRISIISPIFFQLNRVENDKKTAHLRLILNDHKPVGFPT